MENIKQIREMNTYSSSVGLTVGSVSFVLILILIIIIICFYRAAEAERAEEEEQRPRYRFTTKKKKNKSKRQERDTQLEPLTSDTQHVNYAEEHTEDISIPPVTRTRPPIPLTLPPKAPRHRTQTLPVPATRNADPTDVYPITIRVSAPEQEPECIVVPITRPDSQ